MVGVSALKRMRCALGVAGICDILIATGTSTGLAILGVTWTARLIDTEVPIDGAPGMKSFNRGSDG